MSWLWPGGLSSCNTDSRRSPAFHSQACSPWYLRGSRSDQEAQIHHFLLFFLEPPGDCQTARGDQEAGRQGRGLLGSHPAPASQAAAAEGPGKPGRAFQLGQCKQDLNFTSCLTVHCAYQGPRGVFRHVRRGHPSRGSGWTERAAAASAPSSPALPRGTGAPSQTERIPKSNSGSVKQRL